jgi:hypothetical protein
MSDAKCQVFSLKWPVFAANKMLCRPGHQQGHVQHIADDYKFLTITSQCFVVPTINSVDQSVSKYKSISRGHGYGSWGVVYTLGLIGSGYG